MSYIVKTALIGDYSVGKSSIVSRFTKDIFPTFDISTLGVDFDCKLMDFKENNYKIQIWDTAGQEKFQSIVKSYIRDVNVCILVCDVNNYQSFTNLKKWLDEILFITDNENLVFQIVGNKNDLNKHLRQIPHEEIEEFCRTQNIDYMECSAKNNDNINQIFLNVIEKINDLVLSNKIKLKTYGTFKEMKPEINVNEKSPKCCIIL